MKKLILFFGLCLLAPILNAAPKKTEPAKTETYTEPNVAKYHEQQRAKVATGRDVYGRKIKTKSPKGK